MSKPLVLVLHQRMQANRTRFSPLTPVGRIKEISIYQQLTLTTVENIYQDGQIQFAELP